MSWDFTSERWQEPAVAIEAEPGLAVGRASGLAAQVVAQSPQVAVQPVPERRAFADPEAAHLQQSDSSEEFFGFPAKSIALSDP